MSLPLSVIIRYYLGTMTNEALHRLATAQVERELVKNMRPLAGKQYEPCTSCGVAQPHTYESHLLNSKFGSDPELVARVRREAGWE